MDYFNRGILLLNTCTIIGKNCHVCLSYYCYRVAPFPYFICNLLYIIAYLLQLLNKSSLLKSLEFIRDYFLYSKILLALDMQNGSAVDGTCCERWQPEDFPLDPCGGKRQ